MRRLPPELSFAPAPGAAPLCAGWRRQPRCSCARRSATASSSCCSWRSRCWCCCSSRTGADPDLAPGPGSRSWRPGAGPLAILSSAFTGRPSPPGLERRYGVLKLLAATPLGRTGCCRETLALLVTELPQIVVLVVISLLLGWRPGGGWGVPIPLLLLVGTIAFSGLGLLLAGTLRAEATRSAPPTCCTCCCWCWVGWRSRSALPGWLEASVGAPDHRPDRGAANRLLRVRRRPLGGGAGPRGLGGSRAGGRRPHVPLASNPFSPSPLSLPSLPLSLLPHLPHADSPSFSRETGTIWTCHKPGFA